MTTDAERNNLDFIRDAKGVVHRAVSPRSTIFLYSSIGFFAAFLTWAYFAELEEITRGDGRVIPSSRMQVIQSLEAGIVKDIKVSEGDIIKKDQVLLKIADTGFSSDLGELAGKELALQAQIIRLQQEATEGQKKKLIYPDTFIQKAPDVVKREKNLFKVRQQTLESRLARFKETLNIAKREYAINAPLARRGILSKTEVLKLEREISDLKGKLDDLKLTFQQEAQNELNAKQTELVIIQQSIKAARDKVFRTELRSPVAGVVNKIHVNTIGGVVSSGEPLIEITPIEDTLFVEVKIEPKDIAFIAKGDKSQVKISAYDYTVYGTISGNVDVISSDSVVDELTKERYYLVTIKTKDIYLRKGKEILPIIPGMVATADIITGKKSVLDYLLKPIIKARSEALRER